MSEVVRYNNDLNLVQFNKFKDKELDLFFSICYKMKEQSLNEITLDFSELKKISNYTNTNLESFIKDLDNTYKKLIELNFKYEDKKVLERFVLFTQYRIEKDNRIVKIAVNEKFKYILNELGTTYTKFELEQFVSLRSTYSKNLFKILKQWETTREKIFELKEFRIILDIPASYTFSKLNEKILNPVIKELNPYFSNFKLEKIRVGRKIQKLKFSWSLKEMKQAKLIEIEIVISEKLNKTLEKAKKNKFLNPVLKKENIKKFLEIFDENILINAFNKAYTEIKKEINFNYLKAYIENSLKQQEIKFVVQTEVQEVEIVKEKEKELKKEIKAPKEKRKVTQEEKNKKYKGYLEKNNLEDNKYNKKSFEVNFNKNYELIEPKDLQKNILKSEPEKNNLEKDNEYLKKLKEIEFDLILSRDLKYEEFKDNLLQYERLIILLNEEIQLLSDDKINKIKIILEELKKYFNNFNSKEVQIINYEDIEEEKLLSKNKKKLFGGALISRLKKIAKEERLKIKYKNKIIS